jgi:hypothetical protein
MDRRPLARGWSGVKGACHRCGTEVDARIGVRDVCGRCSAYLHCCRNCEFYEPGLHNDCREPNAEPAADKEQANFCDYFRFSRGGGADSPGRSDRTGDGRKRNETQSPSLASDVRNQLSALFRRK